MTSTLDLTGEEAPVVDAGHGTAALGPSDSSDSGSDVMGGPGMDEGLSDEQAREMPMATTQSAGRDLGDLDLDSDSDRAGTGERGSSGLESTPTDQQLTIDPGMEAGTAELDDPDVLDVSSIKDDTEVDAADAEADADADAEQDESEADVADGAT